MKIENASQYAPKCAKCGKEFDLSETGYKMAAGICCRLCAAKKEIPKIIKAVKKDVPKPEVKLPAGKKKVAVKKSNNGKKKVKSAMVYGSKSSVMENRL